MFEKGKALLRSWLDGVERQLAVEAERAGVFKHPTITGGARENVVRKVLRDLLPPQVEVGTGRVIGADCEPSKQADVVVFDGRFPVLRMGDDSLYPVEGVIATIEVKSHLDQAELENSMHNALSVMRISPSFIKEDADQWIAQRVEAGASQEQAHEELRWTLMPRSYVFAFAGLQSKAAQAQALQTSMSNVFEATPSRPLIPSVMVGGAAVTVALGNAFRVRVSDSRAQEQLDTFGVAITFDSGARFGVLTSHLLSHLEQRTLMVSVPGTIRRAIQSYLPFGEYINDCIHEREFAVTLWHERSAYSLANTDMPSL